jgi:hypothetical protein
VWCSLHGQELTAVNRTLVQLVDEHHVLEERIRELHNRDRAAFQSAIPVPLDTVPTEGASEAAAFVSDMSALSSTSLSASSLAVPVSSCTTLVSRSPADSGSSVGSRDPGDEFFVLPSWSFEVDARTDMQLM